MKFKNNFRGQICKINFEIFSKIKKINLNNVNDVKHCVVLRKGGTSNEIDHVEQ